VFYDYAITVPGVHPYGRQSQEEGGMGGFVCHLKEAVPASQFL